MRKYLACILLLFLLSGCIFQHETPKETPKEPENPVAVLPDPSLIPPPNESIFIGNTTAPHPVRPTGHTVISAAQLATHSTREDCWVAYNGEVFDLTDWLPRHPGSAGAIAPYCGTSDEFKAAFERKHGKTKVKLLMTVAKIMGDFEVKGNLQG